MLFVSIQMSFTTLLGPVPAVFHFKLEGADDRASSAACKVHLMLVVC